MPAIVHRFFLNLTLVLPLAIAGAAASAQTYPVRPITLIVPFVGGSASDVVSRIMAERMSRSMGQPIVVENQPGAGGNAGTAVAARANPDGYTLAGAGSGPVGANVTLYRDLPYNPEKDFEAISPFAHFTIVIVASAKLPANSLSDLIAYAKANPGKLNYGSVGIGSSQHLGGAYFEQVVGVKLTHVPYRNIARYGPDLIAGQVPLGFQWLPNVKGPLESKGAKALAVAGKTRMAALPQVPTTIEAGLPNYIASGWFALLAPRGTPRPIIERLNQELKAAVADPAVRERFLAVGAEPVALTPDEATQFIADEIVKWRDVITKAGIAPIQ